jgi:hypothetical protein
MSWQDCSWWRHGILLTRTCCIIWCASNLSHDEECRQPTILTCYHMPSSLQLKVLATTGFKLQWASKLFMSLVCLSISFCILRWYCKGQTETEDNQQLWLNPTVEIWTQGPTAMQLFHSHIKEHELHTMYRETFLVSLTTELRRHQQTGLANSCSYSRYALNVPIPCTFMSAPRT